MKICIDPGHYGSYYNPGVSSGYVESNFTWDYSWLLKKELEKYGIEVVMTRTEKAENPGLSERGRGAKGCDLFISVHSNGSDTNPDADMVFCMYSVRTGDKALAQCIADGLTDFFKKEWGSIQEPAVYALESKSKPGYDYYGVLRGCSSVDVPGIIVEHSFHTNKKYCDWAMTPGNIEKMAVVEAQLYANYYGLKKIDDGVDDMFIELTVDLKKGDKGEEVKKMQRRFRQISAEFDAEVVGHSYKDGEPDGSFGGSMVKTVKKFQNYAGIAETGMLDELTRTILNSNIGVLYQAWQADEGIIEEIRSTVN